ncbi:hypothetical protein BFF78_00960 [Streptomyces fodineus]|uniref:Uncharacterized protein n=1 Tax=Streptomyces fodineus TaxID=1904616 RepID=A0A1D7Y2N5_9ACTN|nr:hypothetical protein BFF78_00960 [Streptomyces fodineus]
MMVVTWSAVGGSIRSVRICLSNSARIGSLRRSLCRQLAGRDADLAGDVLDRVARKFQPHLGVPLLRFEAGCRWGVTECDRRGMPVV